MSNKWYIGQEIVCIKTHSHKVVKSGEIFTIKNLSICGCKTILIDVGIITTSKNGICGVCNSNYELFNTWWLSERLFAPLEYNQDEINRVLEMTIKEKL